MARTQIPAEPCITAADELYRAVMHRTMDITRPHAEAPSSYEIVWATLEELRERGLVVAEDELGGCRADLTCLSHAGARALVFALVVETVAQGYGLGRRLGRGAVLRCKRSAERWAG